MYIITVYSDCSDFYSNADLIQLDESFLILPLFSFELQGAFPNFESILFPHGWANVRCKLPFISCINKYTALYTIWSWLQLRFAYAYVTHSYTYVRENEGSIYMAAIGLARSFLLSLSGIHQEKRNLDIMTPCNQSTAPVHPIKIFPDSQYASIGT